MSDAAGGPPPEGPSQEPGANGPPVDGVESRVKAVVRDITSRPTRHPNGRWLPGASGHAKTLINSATLLAELAPVKADIVARVLADRGHGADVPETLAGIVDAYAESRLLRQSMWCRLVEQGGPVTGKGKKRALFDAYLGALDREVRLATTIGLDRRTKRVDLARVLSGLDHE